MFIFFAKTSFCCILKSLLDCLWVHQVLSLEFLILYLWIQDIVEGLIKLLYNTRNSVLMLFVLWRSKRYLPRQAFLSVIREYPGLHWHIKLVIVSTHVCSHWLIFNSSHSLTTATVRQRYYRSTVSRHLSSKAFNTIHTSKDFYKYLFFPRTITDWNSLTDKEPQKFALTYLYYYRRRMQMSLHKYVLF